MTDASGAVWVGDHVYDARAEREGIITDVEGGRVYELRPVRTSYGGWTTTDPDALRLITSRQDLLDASEL